MKRILCSLALISTATGAFANDRVIYGVDDRRDLYADDVDPKMRELAKSTALLVRKMDLIPEENRSLSKLNARKLGDSVGRPMCSDEPFYDQPVAGYCSSFLVGPDLLATAGHCLMAVGCEGLAVVFGYSLDTPDKDLSQISGDDVYFCKEVVVKVLEPALGEDFAVIKLDRQVAHRSPLKFRQSGEVAVGDSLTVIGHPMTLPTKIASSRTAVRSTSAQPFFVATIDSYSGNSGSAVINSDTYEVEGILVRGEMDLQFEAASGCVRSKVCDPSSCRGEDVTRISNLLDYIVPPSFDPRPREILSINHQNLDLEIPDGGHGESDNDVVIEFEISEDKEIANVSLNLGFAHDYSGDLQIRLIHPDGSEAMMPRVMGLSGFFNVGFGQGSNIIPSLKRLGHKKSKGIWKVVVEDRYSADVGRLLSAQLRLEVYGTAEATVETPELEGDPSFAAIRP